MDWSQISRIAQSIKDLGGKRAGALAGIGALIFAFIFGASYFATRSAYEILYIGLTQQDVSRMGSVLSESGIAFEASIDGTKLSVPVGQAAEARARLAEKGLPGSATAGYELFDKLGALGLTSFMQQVTKVRVLEGELARTIQNLRGVKAARVHIVLPEHGSLRLNHQQSAASVVIKTELQGDASATMAIRHLVASAIPEMTANQVSVISTDGAVLASSMDATTEVSSKAVELERSIARQLQDNVRRTLVPYLGLENFEVSANVRLNVDKRQTNETAYDPDKRVERSVRVVKEAQSAQEASGRSTVSVEQNVPGEGSGAAGSDQNKRAQDRKEETTNYEIATKSTATTSEGYRIENLSVAIVVNKKRISESLGKEPTPEELQKEIAEIERLAGSAAGIDEKRGDRLSIAAVNFSPVLNQGEGDSGSGLTAVLISLGAGLIKSITIIAVGAIVLLAGVKPMMRTMLSDARSGNPLTFDAQISSQFKSRPALGMPEMQQEFADGQVRSFTEFGGAEAPTAQQLVALADPQRKLQEIFSADEERSTAVIRSWVRTG